MYVQRKGKHPIEKQQWSSDSFNLVYQKKNKFLLEIIISTKHLHLVQSPNQKSCWRKASLIIQTLIKLSRLYEYSVNL